MPEFCDAAFGKAARPMPLVLRSALRRNHALLGPHRHPLSGVDLPQPIEGRPRKTVRDPFRLIAFLYPPNLLAALDADLGRAEKAADCDKVKTRLALVRTEFEYVRHLARWCTWITPTRSSPMPTRATACSTRLTTATRSSPRFTPGLPPRPRPAAGPMCCFRLPGTTPITSAWPTMVIKSRMPTPA